MRTTLNIDDEILQKASRLTGIKEKTACSVGVSPQDPSLAWELA